MYDVKNTQNSVYGKKNEKKEEMLKAKNISQCFVKEKGEKTAKYTLRHEAEKMEIAWESENRVLASKLEFNIKRLTKKQKEELIKNPKLLNKFLGDKIQTELYSSIKGE